MKHSLQPVAVLSLALLFYGQISPLFAAENAAHSNESVLVQLCRDIVAQFNDELRLPDTTAIVVEVGSKEADLFFTPALLEVFRSRFSTVYLRGEAPGVTVNAAVQEFHIAYGKTFSDGMFSAERTERTISETWRFTAVRKSDSRVLWAGTKDATSRDTVDVAEISQLEQSSARLTVGIGPQHSAYEKLFEPFIIVAAAGVAVYLFFTIRS